MKCIECGQELPKESAFQRAFRKAETQGSLPWVEIEEKFPRTLKAYVTFRQAVINEVMDATKADLMDTGHVQLKVMNKMIDLKGDLHGIHC